MYTIHDYCAETVNRLLSHLPEAAHSSAYSSPNTIITRDAALKALKVVHMEFHAELLEEFIHWNGLTVGEQDAMGNFPSDYYEIMKGIREQIFVSVNKNSENPVFLTLKHDSHEVHMRID